MCLRIKATLLLVSLFSAWSLKSEVLYDNAAIALIDSNGHAEIPENYTSIDIRAFDGAQTLRSVTIPDSITKIGEYAFSNTPYLTSIVIPSSVTAIYDGTFSGSGIKSIKIPSSVTYVGWNNFSLGINNCDILESVEIGMSEIPNEIFTDCTNLETLILEETVIVIGNYSFSGTAIKDLVLPNSVLEIGVGSFNGIRATDLIIPDSVTTIGQSAFNSSALARVSLSQSTNSIADLAFAYTQLESVLIPSSEIYLGKNSFYTQFLSKAFVVGKSGYWNGTWAFHPDTEIIYCNDVDSDGDEFIDCVDSFPNNPAYNADSDSDGMPDSWEIKYGLDPNDPSDATSDIDNDGVSALNEFLAGTIPSRSIDLDGNDQYDALTDGLMLLRSMFGYDGSALVAGTITSDAIYTDSVDIESRIETLGELADIDGNGQIDALTDGLLTLRYLFGYEGDTLINGVVAVDATRTTAEEIEAHLETLMPAF